MALILSMGLNVLDAAWEARPEALTFVTVVIGSAIPTTVGIACLLAAIGPTALIAARIMAKPRSVHTRRNAVVTVSFVLAVPGALVACAIAALFSWEFTVLPDQSPGGCHLVAREFSLLTVTQGDLGILQRGSTSPQWNGAFYVASGATEFLRSHEYDLEWERRYARVRVGSGGRSGISQDHIDRGLVCASG